MKKIFLLVMGLMFISGCELNYNLYYKSEDNIVETASIGIETASIMIFNSDINDYFYDVFSSYKQAYNLKKYDYKIDEGKNISYIELNKKHEDLNSLLDNEVLNMFFTDRNVYNEGNNVVLELSNYNYTEDVSEHMEISEVNINVKSNYRLTSNADEVNDFFGSYKWVFDKDSKDKTIKITFSDEINFTAMLFNSNPVLLIVITTLMLCMIIYIFVRIIIKKNKSRNKI